MSRYDFAHRRYHCAMLFVQQASTCNRYSNKCELVKVPTDLICNKMSIIYFAKTESVWRQ